MEENKKLIKTKIIDFYNERAHTYYDMHYGGHWDYSPLLFRQLYVEQMVDYNLPNKGVRILDIGCGPGELCISLVKKGYDVFGADISIEMIKKALSAFEKYGLRNYAKMLIGDLNDLPYKDCVFDAVVAAGVIEYQKGDENSILEIRRVLKKGGYLIINVTNRYSIIYWIVDISVRLKRLIRIQSWRTLKRTSFIKERTRSRLESRKHSPFKFNKSISKHGFRKINHNYFHFSPLPAPFEKIFSCFCQPIGKWMEMLTHNRLALFLGGGYLLIAQREK